MTDERRAIPRADDPPLDIDGAWTTIYNVSLSGMCIVTARSLQVGERTSFRLKDRDLGETWDLTGEIVWVQNLVSGLSRIGIRWVDPDRGAVDWLANVMNRCREGADGKA